jgi:hypothetical protein
VEEFAPWLDKEFPFPAVPGELRWYVVEGDKLSWLESGDEVVVMLQINSIKGFGY